MHDHNNLSSGSFDNSPSLDDGEIPYRMIIETAEINGTFGPINNPHVSSRYRAVRSPVNESVPADHGSSLEFPGMDECPVGYYP